jgi:hypothetical protein
MKLQFCMLFCIYMKFDLTVNEQRLVYENEEGLREIK